MKNLKLSDTQIASLDNSEKVMTQRRRQADRSHDPNLINFDKTGSGAFQSDSDTLNYKRFPQNSLILTAKMLH